MGFFRWRITGPSIGVRWGGRSSQIWISLFPHSGWIGERYKQLCRNHVTQTVAVIFTRTGLSFNTDFWWFTDSYWLGQWAYSMERNGMADLLSKEASQQRLNYGTWRITLHSTAGSYSYYHRPFNEALEDREGAWLASVDQNSQQFCFGYFWFLDIVYWYYHRPFNEALEDRDGAFGSCCLHMFCLVLSGCLDRISFDRNYFILRQLLLYVTGYMSAVWTA